MAIMAMAVIIPLINGDSFMVQIMIIRLCPH